MGAWDDAGPELAVALGGAGGGTIASSQDDEYRQVVFRSLQNIKEKFILRRAVALGGAGGGTIAGSQDDEYRQVVFPILFK
jgi:hypothetical protein